uniref:Phosphoribosylformylglycinamidine synthase n=1 Tax=Strigamia maritima TaxID=126957 RepID=T1IU41_STRMM
MLLLYCLPALTKNQTNSIQNKLLNVVATCENVKNVVIKNVDVEFCFYILSNENIEDLSKLIWILGEPFNAKSIRKTSHFDASNDEIIEIGPRLNFTTAFSTNAVSICHSVGITNVDRIEKFIRYRITLETDQPMSPNLQELFANCLHDKMTHCRYITPLEKFHQSVNPQSWYEVDVMKERKKALQNVNADLGLALDDWDIDYYTNLFCNKIKRNPTSVECFDLAQSNSEHSRHWFFKGKMFVDGIEQPLSLLDMVIQTQQYSNQNNVIKFCDNSSAIEGHKIPVLIPLEPNKCSSFIKDQMLRHLIFTAETHNFPTAVSPFSGAATGTGGRIRDVQAAGRGAHVIAGIAGYCFGNIHLPGYALSWENISEYPSNFAHPRQVIIEASNGASDYGNKFGEPVVAGFSRSCGIVLSNKERREWVKPIMFSGGIGSIDDKQTKKLKPIKGMEVVKIGGPVYRIGVGGGAASSVQVQGDNAEELDFGAVQRGDAEMEQKLNRVIRACVEMGNNNPICSIHDQGAGGNGNVLKEIVEPQGAVIYSNAFQFGDPTISILELWGAEYQESNAVLVKNCDKNTLNEICLRERCPVSFVGNVTDNQKITLIDTNEKLEKIPVDLDLELVLGNMPQKEFHFAKIINISKPLQLPLEMNCSEALQLVLRLPSVASKRFLTNKVDRCVTGLVAQQQCVGPLHTPLADVAVIALSYFDTVGGAVGLGEQPIKGLVDCTVGARMSVAEAITNLVFAPITSLQDVKCSANWMWAAKLPGEGAALYSACAAMTDVMQILGIAVDGGKDSLSMAAKVGHQTVKAPGTIVISAYAMCTDITNIVTPDFKCPDGKGCVLLVQMTPDKNRLGGTALAQVMAQVGDEAPDLDDPIKLRNAFLVTQKLIKEEKILSGHDVSDGGLITCILEMCFAGNCGVEIDIQVAKDIVDNEIIISSLFNEEVGWVFEVTEAFSEQVTASFKNCGVSCKRIGHSLNNDGQKKEILIKVNDAICLNDKMTKLRDDWEETSFQLELLQTNIDCVMQEKVSLQSRQSPPFHWPWEFKSSLTQQCTLKTPPTVAIIREEGTNGDREMSAAFFSVGFQVWDVTMSDVTSKQVTLDRFRGLVFPGGFSYADVLGSAKGWAASMMFNAHFQAQLNSFKSRDDTFSLGVCNGCQLMALLGWISPDESNLESNQGVLLKQNISERFECRFSTVKIVESPSIMLNNMADAVLGVWVAHGEGRFEFKNEEIRQNIAENHLVPMQYVDDDANETTCYPFNPNGSPGGVAAICSVDGRHLAIMPHPERSIFPWQWPWMTENWKKSMIWSPWMQMFENAFTWCTERTE